MISTHFSTISHICWAVLIWIFQFLLLLSCTVNYFFFYLVSKKCKFQNNSVIRILYISWAIFDTWTFFNEEKKKKKVLENKIVCTKKLWIYLVKLYYTWWKFYCTWRDREICYASRWLINQCKIHFIFYRRFKEIIMTRNSSIFVLFFGYTLNLSSAREPNVFCITEWPTFGVLNTVSYASLTVQVNNNDKTKNDNHIKDIHKIKRNKTKIF